MLNATVDTDVLIVGAGPVGLTLANDLAIRGVPFRIIDLLAEPCHQYFIITRVAEGILRRNPNRSAATTAPTIFIRR